MRFANRAVIVTGGGSGIGEACSLKFAGEGASVVIADWNDTDGERVTASINAMFPAKEGPPRALAVKTDVSKEWDVADPEYFRRARHRPGRLLCAAGTTGRLYRNHTEVFQRIQGEVTES